MSARALTAVRRAAQKKTAAQDAYREAILSARANGASIQEIADAASVARQNVYKLIRRAERGDNPEEG